MIVVIGGGEEEIKRREKDLEENSRETRCIRVKLHFVLYLSFIICISTLGKKME